MNRRRILIVLAVLLLAGNVFYYVWKGWGLITIHAQDRPLSEIARSIERQGHVTLKYDLDPATKVSMNVVRVPVSEALETLSTVTESRWRLTYVFGSDAAAVRGEIATLSSDQRDESLTSLYVPLPPIGADSDGPLPDPRRDTWAVKVPDEHKLQAYLEGAAKGVSAEFVVPASWNPDVNSAPSSGQIRKVAPKLASAAKGKVEEIFLLAKNQRPRGDDGERPDPGDGGGGRFGGGLNRGAIGDRMQAEIDKLPPEKRAAAQAEQDERKSFFTALRDLPQEERRAKMEEFFEKTEVQDRMEKMQADRDARRTPEQRMARAQKYRERKQQIMAGGGQGGGGKGR